MRCSAPSEASRETARQCRRRTCAERERKGNVSVMRLCACAHCVCVCVCAYVWVDHATQRVHLRAGREAGERVSGGVVL